MAQRIEYAVVINHEEQYSIWPEGERLPKGYRAVRKGPADDCIRHLEDLLRERGTRG
mgnify:CR=1 FL=1